MKKEMLITDLIEKGWFYQEGLLPSQFCLELMTEARELSWKEAQIGKGAGLVKEASIRNDSICWIDEVAATPAQKKYLALMNDLMLSLNRELFLGLHEFECHFARYETAGFYKKHLDQHQGSQKRTLSTICYLNTPTAGGELVIYNKDNSEEIEATIKPTVGSFVCFLSNQIYHEVLPTKSERVSLTGWFRTV